MKRILITLLSSLMLASTACGQEFVNLTPRPASASAPASGMLTLPGSFAIGVDASLGVDARKVARQLADDLHTSTGAEVELRTGNRNALIRFAPYRGKDAAVLASKEGYTLDISSEGVDISACHSVGFLRAVQSLKKIMPANVTLGKPGKPGTTYTLPLTSITDYPRFEYRGYMLDCSRHFFSVKEIKKILDIMAVYKLNVFHWHFTDDQGWRAEVKRYPRLTTVGAVRYGGLFNDFFKEDNWWTTREYRNTEQYGPFFYTQDEMREVVAYAAARGIEVMPEIEMLGHSVAALVAYPEISCDPEAQRSIPLDGGVFSDVMNPASDKTIEFCKNVIDEMCDIFPCQYFHIGGDECPDNRWKTNAICQAKYKELGLKDFRELQSWFTREISGYLKSKGKRTVVWNESITAANSKCEWVAQNNPIIMCWMPCQAGALKAAGLGLDAIITEYNSGASSYYINRQISQDYHEPKGNGDGDDSVEGTYVYKPVPDNVTDPALLAHYIGVQGTFWSERVSTDGHLEYLTLPRLQAVAEAGWTKQELKNWKDGKEAFQPRMMRDVPLMDMGGYVYSQHWMDGYVPHVYTNPIAIGNVVTFSNYSNDRGAKMQDNAGSLDAQGSASTEWILLSTGTDSEFYIKSRVSGRYLFAPKASAGEQVTLSEQPITKWTFDEATIPSYVAICLVENHDLAVNNNTGNDTHAKLALHAKGNTSSFWMTEKRGVADVNEVVGNATTAIHECTASTGHYYTLQCGAWLSEEDGNVNGRAAEPSYFVFERGTADGQYYIRSTKSGRFVAASGTANKSAVSLSDTPFFWTFETDGETVLIHPNMESTTCLSNKKKLSISKDKKEGAHWKLVDHVFAK